MRKGLKSGGMAWRQRRRRLPPQSGPVTKRLDQVLESMPVRHAAYKTLLGQQRPIGAYDLLAELSVQLGRQLNPTTVYRALDFLIRQRLVTRLESVNAYVVSAC